MRELSVAEYLRQDLALEWRQVTGELQHEAKFLRVCQVLGDPFDLQCRFAHGYLS
jgi:hypothetical protein